MNEEALSPAFPDRRTLKDHGVLSACNRRDCPIFAMHEDRRTQPHDPVTSRYVAALFEAVGTDRVFAVEVHNVPPYDNSFRCPTQHIQHRPAFAEHFAPRWQKPKRSSSCHPMRAAPSGPSCSAAPSSEESGETVDNAFVEKYRSAGVVTGGALVGGVQGRTVVSSTI